MASRFWLANTKAHLHPIVLGPRGLLHMVPAPALAWVGIRTPQTTYASSVPGTSFQPGEASTKWINRKLRLWQRLAAPWVLPALGRGAVPRFWVRSAHVAQHDQEPLQAHRRPEGRAADEGSPGCTPCSKGAILL